MRVLLQLLPLSLSPSLFFFFNDTATPEIYTLSLHDALPICQTRHTGLAGSDAARGVIATMRAARTLVAALIVAITPRDRKSTRLNSSHLGISYAVFCLKKKKKNTKKNNNEL